MKKAFLLVVVLFISVVSTACINNLAVQQLNNKAKEYLDNGDYDNAISRLKSSIDLDSTIFETYYNLGIAYTQAEKYPEAEATFQSAIKLRPSFADTYYSLAVAQENCAQGLIDGSIVLDKEGKLSPKKSEEKETENSHSSKNLNKETKAQVATLLNNSIESYKTYLEKGTKVDDKQQVEEKVEYLETQLKKYSPETQQ